MKSLRLLERALVLTTLTCLLYVFMEWIFFATKPSMFSVLTAVERAAVLFTSLLPLLFVTAVAIAVIFALTTPLRRRLPDGGVAAAWALGLLPAVVVTAMELLLVDNFTHTLFEVGVHGTSGWMQYTYLTLLAILLLYNVRLSVRLLRSEPLPLARERVLSWVAISLVPIGMLFTLALPRTTAALAKVDTGLARDGRAFPNVLIFSSDGINAGSMSAYGYERPTTPFLETIMRDMLVFENHFSNSALTTGSVGSLLSGKLPTTTRVVYRPDFFSGVHVYQHLPGLLRRYGFHNGDFSVRHYADPGDLNMGGAFDWANGRNLIEEELPLSRPYRERLPSSSLFIEQSFDRLKARVAHLLGIRPMVNPFFEVTIREASLSTDRKRLAALEAFIDRAPRPFFAHVHLMGTHGQFFPERNPLFAARKTQDQGWMVDFYDDAVLQFDHYVERIVTFLDDRDLLDRTLFIVSSDHGKRWALSESLPLMIRFPGQEHTGIMRANSQRLDIAPTILDFLGIEQPQWMEGRSLLSAELDPMYPIFTTHRADFEGVGLWRWVASPQPPFYTLNTLGLFACNHFYKLDLITNRLAKRRIRNHTQPCDRKKQPSRDEMRATLVAHLENAGYDVSTLRGAQPRGSD